MTDKRVQMIYMKKFTQLEMKISCIYDSFIFIHASALKNNHSSIQYIKMLSNIFHAESPLDLSSKAFNACTFITKCINFKMMT